MREVKIINDKPEVQPTKEYKKIKETAVVYLMKHKNSDESHLWYKAQSFNFSNEKRKEEWRWASLWNSICTSGKSSSLEKLIMETLKEGHTVIESGFDSYIRGLDENAKRLKM